MSFDFSSRFLYTLEAPFRTFFLFVAFTLFFFFDISGSDKQPSFVLFRSQFQFFTPDFFSRPESAPAGELPSDCEHPLHHRLGFAGLGVAAELLVEAASAKRDHSVSVLELHQSFGGICKTFPPKSSFIQVALESYQYLPWPGIHATWFKSFDLNIEIDPVTHRHSRQGPEDSSTSAPLS